MEEEGQEVEPAKGKASHRAVAEKMIAGLGGKANIMEFGNCVTRLRVQVADPEKVNRDALKTAGATDIMRKGNNVQVVVGVQAQFIAAAAEELL